MKREVLHVLKQPRVGKWEADLIQILRQEKKRQRIPLQVHYVFFQKLQSVRVLTVHFADALADVTIFDTPCGLNERNAGTVQDHPLWLVRPRPTF